MRSAGFYASAGAAPFGAGFSNIGAGIYPGHLSDNITPTTIQLKPVR
jgi:hypothetical protein